VASTIPTIEIGGSASSGGGDASTDAIGMIGQTLAQLIANGSNVWSGTGSSTLYLDAGTIASASPAQIGRVIDGVTITAAIVAQNQAFLNEIGAYCRANGISITVGAQLGNPPVGDWTYQWLNPAVEAGLPITKVEDVSEPEHDNSTPPAQWASYEAQIVAQIAQDYPTVQIGSWVGGSPTTAASYWTAYNSLAQSLNLPQICYAVADTSWNAPSVNSPAQWTSWLQQLSGTLQQLGMTLTVLLDGTNGDISPTQWTAQSEQHAALLAQIPGVDVTALLIRTWDPGGPTADSPLNQPDTLGNDAMEIAATWSLYSHHLITASGRATLGCPSQASTTAGQPVSLDGITVTFDGADVANGARFALVITGDGATFYARANGAGVVDGSGSGTIVLDGTQAEIQAELQSLTMTEAASGPDTVDVELFNDSGRVADQQIDVSTTDPGRSSPSPTLTFLPSSSNGGLAAGWTSETETLSGGKVTSELFTWNSTTINPLTGQIQIVKQDAIRLPDNVPGVIWINGVPQNPAANLIGSDPLSTTFNANAFNPLADYAQLTVLATSIVFNPQSGDVETTTDTLAPYPTASGSGQGPAYLGSGGEQVTYDNTGNDPFWNAAWGNQFTSVAMTYGSHGQLLEMVYQGSAANGYQTIDQVFDPITRRLMESIESFLPPSQYSWFVSGPVDITYFNTGDNPEWDGTEWGPRAQVTVNWRDYYAIGVGSTPPAPMLLSWTGASQCGQQLWYASGPSNATLNGIGSPGNVITVSRGGVVLGTCTVGSDGQWALTLNAPLGPGLSAVSIAEADTRDGTSASSTILMQTGSAFAGTAASVVANLDALQILVRSGRVSTIRLTDATTPTITITAAQAVNDSTALGRITGSHDLTITGATAADAAGMASQPNVTAVLINDSLASVAANLPALEALAAKGILRSISLTDAVEPTLTLTASQVSAGALALSLVTGAYVLTITGTTATIPTATVAGITLLGQNKPQIALKASTGDQAWSSVIIDLNPSGQIAGENFYWRAGQPDISTSLVYTSGQLYQSWVDPVGGGYVLSENDLTGTRQWSSFVQTVNPANQLLSLSYTMRSGQAYAHILRDFSDGAVSSETDTHWTGGYQTITYDLAGVQLWNCRIQCFNSLGILVSNQYNWRVGQPYLSSATWYSATTGAVTAQVNVTPNGGQIASNVTAASLAAIAALQNLRSVSFADTSTDFVANLGTLESLAAKGLLVAAAFTDNTTPTLTLTASQVRADAAALSTISSTYYLAVTGVTAANAASVAGQPHVTQISVSDTATNVQANIGSLETLATGGKLGSIGLTDAGTPTLTLTASQVRADAAALGTISGAYNLHVTGITAANAASVAGQPHVTRISVSDTAVDVLADIGALEILAAAGKLGSITLTDPSKPGFTLTAAQVTAYASVLAAISSPYSLSETGLAAANAANAAAQANVVRVTVSDTAVNVQANLGSLETLAANGKLGSIALTDAGTPTFNLTAAQISGDAAVLALITSPYSITASGVTAANATKVAGQPHVTRVSVSDTSVAILTNLGALQTLAAGGRLGAITWTDTSKPTVSIAASKLAADALALGLIGSTYNLTITGTAGSIPTATVSSIKLVNENDPQITLTDATGSQAWSSIIVVLNSSGQLLSEQFNWRAGQPYLTTDQTYTNGVLYQTRNNLAEGGYILTQHDTTGTQPVAYSVLTVSAQNTVEHLQQVFRPGQAATEVDSYYDVTNPNSHEVLTYSGPNVQVQMFNASGAQMSSDTVAASAISDQLLGGPLQFIYGTTASPNLKATSVADEFVITPPDATVKAFFEISGFDIFTDIIALPSSIFGNDQQIMKDTHSAFGGALVYSQYGTSQVLLPGVDPTKLHAWNFLNS
jgi:hypothetical protein